MSENYCVALKESVFRETPLTEADFDGDLQLSFSSQAAAEEWVTEQNQTHSKMGQLTLHTAHPNDQSDVSAYVVFQPSNGVWVPDS
jgi:hypothetical protein